MPVVKHTVNEQKSTDMHRTPTAVRGKLSNFLGRFDNVLRLDFQPTLTAQI